MISAVDVIIAKRDGRELPAAWIDWVIDGYVTGAVADEQMAALAMAVLLKGMNHGEISAWTRAMTASGERLDLSGVDRPTVDKHSTGGVGDKITLPLVPLVAACGAAVPQLSGRGLGHTGGTLDKLEAVPGWRSRLSVAEILRQLDGVGAVICAPTEGLVPADRRLYALRDVTGTVESIPLIASSIMSKKIAEGAGALVLDVKFGSGAFMKTEDRARELARTMVAIGADHELVTRAVLTDMSVPLGCAVGGALEVEESVEVLRGGGPGEITELTLALAGEMLRAAGIGGVDPRAVLASGAAYGKWRDMITAQGGDPDAPLPRARCVRTIEAVADGFVSTMDAHAVGVAAWRLGAGRARKEDSVNPAAGIRCLVKPGDRVVRGQPMLELHTDVESLVAGALAALDGQVTVTGRPPRARPDLVRELLT